MAEPIIGGPDSKQPQAPRATSGGVMETKPLPYKPPVGPSNQMQQGPGIHGTVMPCGTQRC